MKFWQQLHDILSGLGMFRATYGHHFRTTLTQYRDKRSHNLIQNKTKADTHTHTHTHHQADIIAFKWPEICCVSWFNVVERSPEGSTVTLVAIYISLASESWGWANQLSVAVVPCTVHFKLSIMVTPSSLSCFPKCRHPCTHPIHMLVTLHNNCH